MRKEAVQLKMGTSGYTHLINGGVMLREAKHLWLFPWEDRSRNDQRWKAWPRGLRPLRCSFACDQNDSYEAAGSKPNDKRQDQ